VFLGRNGYLSLGEKRKRLLIENKGIPYGKVKDGSVVATLDISKKRYGRAFLFSFCTEHKRRGQSSLSFISIWLPPVA